MSNSSFRQKAAAWQQTFQRKQAGGFLQRLLAWLILGVMLVIGISVMLFLLLLSWLLIPVLLYRYRKNLKAWQQRNQQSPQREQPSSSQVIEGEVISKKED